MESQAENGGKIAKGKEKKHVKVYIIYLNIHHAHTTSMKKWT